MTVELTSPQVAGEIDRIVIPTNRETEDEILQSLKKEAIQLAVENGAHPDLIKVVQMDVFQLPYISMQAVRGIVKAVSFLSLPATHGELA